MSVTLSRKHFKKGFDDTLTLKHLRNAAGSMFGDRSQVRVEGQDMKSEKRSVVLVRCNKTWHVKRAS